LIYPIFFLLDIEKNKDIELLTTILTSCIIDSGSEAGIYFTEIIIFSAIKTSVKEIGYQGFIDKR
jgi:hypothetical protein